MEVTAPLDTLFDRLCDAHADLQAAERAAGVARARRLSAIRELTAAGVSMTAIAARLDISRQAVAKTIDRKEPRV